MNTTHVAEELARTLCQNCPTVQLISLLSRSSMDLGNSRHGGSISKGPAPMTRIIKSLSIVFFLNVVFVGEGHAQTINAANCSSTAVQAAFKFGGGCDHDRDYPTMFGYVRTSQVTLTIPSGSTNLTVQGSTTIAGTCAPGASCTPTDGTTIVDNCRQQQLSAHRQDERDRVLQVPNNRHNVRRRRIRGCEVHRLHSVPWFVGQHPHGSHALRLLDLRFERSKQLRDAVRWLHLRRYRPHHHQSGCRQRQ